QNGVPNIPPQTDYSNKQDSNTLVKTTVGSDTLNVINWWVKGVPHALAPIYTHSGGGSVTADNGLNISSGSNVQLGGALTKNTDINGASGFYYLNGSGFAQWGLSTDLTDNGDGTF